MGWECGKGRAHQQDAGQVERQHLDVVHFKVAVHVFGADAAAGPLQGQAVNPEPMAISSAAATSHGEEGEGGGHGATDRQVPTQYATELAVLVAPVL